MRKMTIIRTPRGNYIPKHDADLPMFKHCCEGMIEVSGHAWPNFTGIFIAHGIALEYIVEDAV